MQRHQASLSQTCCMVTPIWATLPAGPATGWAPRLAVERARPPHARHHYLITTALPISVRRAHGERPARYYLDRLASAGVTDLPRFDRRSGNIAARSSGGVYVGWLTTPVVNYGGEITWSIIYALSRPMKIMKTASWLPML